MRHLSVSRRNSLVESRKIPLNTIILPPLTPPLPENGAQLIGTVTVNKAKSGTVNGDLVVTRSPDVSTRNNPEAIKGTEQSRAFQLEQNIRFLQEQHQLMLAGLHNEIDSLKNRNRELQFQLVFVKSATPVSSPASSSEDDLKHKVYSSPKQANVTPLHVEILERELGELKLQLQEAESRNIYLSAIVDEQKKKLERFERDQTNLSAEADLNRRLDDAESLIRRLRRENSDLRKEHASRCNVVRNGSDSNGYSTTPRSSGGLGGIRGNGASRHKGNNSHYRANWFPPLHSQSYWQQGRRTTNEPRPAAGKNGVAPETTSCTQNAPNMLPDVHQSQSTHQQQRQGRRGNNNNHYQEGGGGGGRKYHRSQQKNGSGGHQHQQT